MKKNRLILTILTILVILAVSLLAVACNPNDGNTPAGPTKYTLTFIADGNPLTTINEEAGKPVTPPSAPQIDNKTFKGWYSNANGTGETAVLPNFMPAQDLTYYAVYETLPAPPVANDSFNEKGGENVLLVFGDEVVFEYADSEIRAELSSNGDYADFSIDGTNYCVTLDYDAKTYSVFRYGANPEAYALYFPTNNTFNFERNLYLKADNKFEVMSQTFGSYTEGTYGPVGTSSDEFILTVTKNYPYNPFMVDRIKLTKIFRADEDDPNDTLVYNAFMRYDADIAGEFIYYEIADRTSHLSLDGYGYAIYTDADGIKHNGVVELTEVDVFSDTFVTFTSKSTGSDILFVLIPGELTDVFAQIGDEIGIYRVWDIAEQTAGSYYVLLDGFGGLTLYYGADIAYNPEIQAATGSYSFLDSGEIECTIDEITNESVLSEAYKESFRFKLTTYGSGLYVTDAFVLFNEDLYKEYADEHGTANLILDGYGNAKLVQNDNTVIEGSLQVLDNLVLITDADENQALFVVTDGEGTNKGSFRQIGLEYGNYFLYSYVNGFDRPHILFLDGEGKATLMEYDENGNTTELFRGSYSKTNIDGNYSVTLDGKAFTAAFRQINFGDYFTPDWRSVYIVYDENMAGTFRNTNGTETLVLDGYGLNAVYTKANGQTISGNFAKEWNVITLLYSDDEGNENILTFTASGNTFAIASADAGVYYEFNLVNDLSSTDTKLIVDGNGNARLSVYNSSTLEYSYQDGTYTINATTGEYTVTLSNASPLRIKLSTRNKAPVFIRYDADWDGTFTDNNGDTLKLDGYGNAEFDYDTVNCLLMGSNLDVVTLTVDNIKHTLTLDRATMKFAETTEPCGYYYPYADGRISGYTRLFLGTNGVAEVYEYVASSNEFRLTSVGTYAKFGEDEGIYAFTSEDGEETFSFLLSELSGLSIYNAYIGSEGTYTKTESIAGEDKTSKLTLDGYGNAEYVFYDEVQQSERTFTGYYTVDENGNITLFAVNYTYGYVYATIVFELDGESFVIISEE